jgi:phosphatidylglycerophosphatase GEP4
MVQSVNLEPLKVLLSSRNVYKLLTPRLHAQSIAHLDYLIIRQTVDYIIFDKDNCLTRPYSDHLELPGAVSRCVAVFGRERVAVLSNSLGCRGEEGEERADLFEKRHGLSVIRHSLKKPSCLPDVLAHFSVPIENADKIAVVGDRLLTDVLMANRFGMYSILVDPITTENDNIAAAMMRWLERRWLGGHKVPRK